MENDCFSNKGKGSGIVLGEQPIINSREQLSDK